MPLIAALLNTVPLALAGLVLLLPDRDVVTVTQAGLQPTQREPAMVPAAHVTRVEARWWMCERRGNKSPDVSVNLAVPLTDGRHVMLPALRRSELERRSCRILVSTSEHPAWEPLLNDAGVPVLWRVVTDAELAECMTLRISALVDRREAPQPARASDLVLHTLEGTTGTRLGRGIRRNTKRETRATTWADNVTIAPPPAVLTPRTGAAVPTWTDFGTPARYWSRVSLAEPALPWRPRELRFEGTGLRLCGPIRSALIPYAAIDRFEVGLRDLGYWHLSVRGIDGQLTDLPGLVRGAGNHLYWSSDLTSARRSPDDSLPWGTDDDDLVAARLNAHLAAIRARHPQPA